MAETGRIETGDGSPANVAYKLLLMLSGREDLKDRKSLLDAYAECLDATTGCREYKQKRG